MLLVSSEYIAKPNSIHFGCFICYVHKKKAHFITLIWVQFTVQKYWKMKITGNKVFRVLIETLVILQASYQNKDCILVYICMQ